MGNLFSRRAANQQPKEESATPPQPSKAFLHGVLHVTITEAKNLPDCDISLLKKNCSDPFVSVDIFNSPHSVNIIKSKTIDNERNPKWQESFRQDMAHMADELVVTVEDKDFCGQDHLGSVRFGIQEIMAGKPLDDWFPLQNKKAQPTKASIHLRIHFTPAYALKKSLEVPDVYFPARPDCMMTLYQDAHATESALHKEIILADGEPWKPASAFKEMYEAIRAAKRFVFIVGWTMHPDRSLLREGDDVMLKELLSQKADDGVKVVVMLWDEAFSAPAPGLPDGFHYAGTNDEKTALALAGTGVHVELLRRHKADASLSEAAFVATFYTHHQKCVIVDSEGPADDERRCLTAFVGGMDLEEGRWDTPEHELYATLDKEHKQDFYNHVVVVRPEAGPRQPWHDIHSKVEGQAAFDVYQNFLDRWNKQVSGKDKQLAEIDQDGLILDGAVSSKRNSDVWSAQLFRSINMDSAVFDPDLYSALTWKKGHARDDSTHRGYVHHIRRASNFLYIENQYFWGSSHAWDNEETKARNLVPMEVVAKVCQKIAEGSRFAAYIIVPMFPEGPMNPEGTMSNLSQKLANEFLYWQAKTLKMMYKKIAEAISKHGAQGSPTDYLNFYCLGKRETEVPDNLPDPEGDQEINMRRHLRLLLYLHSKMFIIDDEYIHIGSTNINQRCLSGNRDTDMGIGAWQPQHTVEKSGGALPKGDVHGFRMSLWAEHTGKVDETYKDPGSLECVQHMNQLAASNWDQYLLDDPCSLQGHLMKYPIQVAQDGTVSALPKHETFPDSSIKVMGETTGLLPNKMTS